MIEALQFISELSIRVSWIDLFSLKRQKRKWIKRRGLGMLIKQ